MVTVVNCVPSDQLEKLLSSPLAVVETDKKCKFEQMTLMEQISWVQGRPPKCANDLGYGKDQRSKINVTAEYCRKIETDVKKCVLGQKIDCFSERENKFLAEMMVTALDHVKEMYATDAMQKWFALLKAFGKKSANQKKEVECAFGLGLGSGSGRSTLMVGLFFPPLFLFYFVYKF